MFYENRTTNQTNVLRMLSCALYCVIENYVCIDYHCCQSKTISDISSDKVFEDKSYNEFLGIFILEVLMNLTSCHVFTKNRNPTVILVCRSWLMNYYLPKRFVIIEHNYKYLSSVPNEAKQRIHAISKQKTDHVMACYTAI